MLAVLSSGMTGDLYSNENKKLFERLYKSNGNAFYIKSTNISVSFVWSYTENKISIYKLSKGKVLDSKELPDLNSGYDGFLIFKPDGNIEAVPVLGYFELSNKKNKKIGMYDSKKNVKNWLDSISGRYGNIIEITDIQTERKRNQMNLSKVLAVYSRSNIDYGKF